MKQLWQKPPAEDITAPEDEAGAEIVAEAAEVVTEAEDEAPVVFADEQVPVPQPDEAQSAKRVFRRLRPEPEFEEELEQPEGDLDSLNEQDEERKRRDSKLKRRQLVFDEELGEVVAVRRRKKGRERDEWDDFLD